METGQKAKWLHQTAVRNVQAAEQDVMKEAYVMKVRIKIYERRAYEICRTS